MKFSEDYNNEKPGLSACRRRQQIFEKRKKRKHTGGKRDPANKEEMELKNLRLQPDTRKLYQNPNNSGKTFKSRRWAEY